MDATRVRTVGLTRSLVCAIAVSMSTIAAAQSPRQRVPWLDLPASWHLAVKDGVVVAVPADLSAGESLALMVEPEGTSSLTLDAEYAKARQDLGGPWTPIGQPVDQPRDGGWTFRVGVGTVVLQGTRYIGQIAVARCGKRRVRTWVLASSAAVFNRYKPVTTTAVASIQDLTLRPRAAPGPAAAAARAEAPPAAGATRGTSAATRGRFHPGKAPPGFGRGISGAYLGLERGVHAHAGYALGSPSLSVEDTYEIDVFLPDGRYRRRFPDHGLASDLAWDRAHNPGLWGTWTRTGSTVTVRRGGYVTTYRVKDARTLVSDRDRPWNKLPLKPGGRLEGVYASSHWLAADGPRLVLHRDGTYEDRGGFLRAFAGAESLVVPDRQGRRQLGPGRGTYTYADLTLTLRDADGRVWQVGLGVPPGERLPSPRWLYLDQSRLLRQ